MGLISAEETRRIEIAADHLFFERFVSVRKEFFAEVSADCDLKKIITLREEKVRLK